MYTIRLQLELSISEKRFLSKSFFYANQMHNQLVHYATNCLNALFHDKDYLEARKTYGEAGFSKKEADNLGVEIKTLEIMPDHVHIFIECDPRIALHKVIKQFKGVSFRKLRNEYPWLKSRIPSLWTRSYFSCTVEHINEDTIIQYIENQKHR